MNIKMIILSTSFIGFHLSAMEYRQSEPRDLPGLLALINTHAIHDHEKIVILPRKFREMALQSAIEKNRLFIAEDQGRIVGYKKLFMINNKDEKSEILRDEIRCIDNEKNCTFAGFINNDGAFVENKAALPSDYYHLCMYNGGDFTLPAYRGKGINAKLTTVALSSCMANIKSQIQDQRAPAITMVYGITQANAGEQPGGPCDRTVGIIKQFKSFIQALENNQGPVVFQHCRYKAFMPTFDPESQILQPLPDEQSIPGFGCVLSCQLTQNRSKI